MVFPYGCIDIIFRKDVLEKKGLTNEIIERYKPTNKHIDDNLILVPCAMSCFAAKAEIEWLKQKGLVYIKDEKAIDFVVVKSLFGTCAKCDWINEYSLKQNLVVDKYEYKIGTICYEFKNNQ